MTLNPQALEAATEKLRRRIDEWGIESMDGMQEYFAKEAIQAYLAALPKVDEDYLCEKLRGAAADCNIRLEIDQQRYILKAILPLIRGG